MALYHFHVTQIKRSTGQSAMACGPIAPGRSSTANVTEKRATTPGRAA